MSGRSREVLTAVNGLLVLGIGAMFVGLPAMVIGAFQERSVAMLGMTYFVFGSLAVLSARRLRGNLNVRLGLLTVLGLLVGMAVRFAVAPARLPLALVEGVLGLLSFVSLLQLISLLRLPPSNETLP